LSRKADVTRNSKETRLRARIDLEQALIEDGGGLVGDRNDLRPGLLNEHFLLGNHGQTPWIIGVGRGDHPAGSRESEKIF